VAQVRLPGYNTGVDKKSASPIAFKLIIGIQVLVVAYIGTFLGLNAPAYLKRAHFAASGGDLSGQIAGQYVPLETVNHIAASLSAASATEFPGIEVQLDPNISLMPTTQASAAKPAPPKPDPIPYVDPNLFVPYTVTIPRIGVRAPLVPIEVNTEKAQQAGLAQGVIHIAGTPEPGEVGTAFYAGHSSDYFFKSGKYKSVFALVPQLKKGDYFILTNDSKAYYFTVNETVITGPNDTSVMHHDNGKEKFAALQTSYPVGTAAKRFVAIGSLTRVADASKLKR
jgi:LPXTG-site transpeptidase (sortase) family protein